MYRLSQGQLTLLEYCPRRFQHSSLDALTEPPSPAKLAAQQWGDRFHLLMQQREMGLPIDTVLAHDAELQACLASLQTTAPSLFDSSGETFRQSEHGRAIALNGYWFTVIYDLLRQWPDRAEIIDWKTYHKPRPWADLKQDWQTRLYLYILTETTALEPQQLAMVYWFVRAQHPETGEPTPQQVRIAYSAAGHAQTHQALQSLTHRLTDWLAAGESLPQLPLGDAKCDPCPFAVRCQRGEAQQPGPSLLSLAAIEEVVI